MGNKNPRNTFYGHQSQLRNIINSWGLILGAQGHEFDSLALGILNMLDRNADVEKIKKVIESELITTYGLYRHEFDASEFASQIMEWWTNQ